MLKIVPYDELESADLVIDAVYEGKAGSQLSGEALGKLLPVGNQGGFRATGMRGAEKLVALYTSGEDPDWPDRLDLNTGQFLYYGDNKRPGHEIHDTARGGNALLQKVFEAIHATPSHKERVPPFFVFQKYITATSSRSFQFRGLAAPGFPGLPPTSDLIAVWKSSDGQRFQNYRAAFTILDVPAVKRLWIEDLVRGEVLTPNCPPEWREWVASGRYSPLVAESTTSIRSVADQIPKSAQALAILEAVWTAFESRPIEFEHFAARVFQMHDSRVIIDEITRGTIDGGRDAVGRYLLGLKDDPVYAEFALEAKCYRPPLNGETANTIGVKETARLISRLRHRQFGVLVTTSVVARQAYEEVREDRHPIIFLCGRDIAEILIANGYSTPDAVRQLISVVREAG